MTETSRPVGATQVTSELDWCLSLGVQFPSAVLSVSGVYGLAVVGTGTTVSGFAGAVTIAAGEASIFGLRYTNDATKTLNVPSNSSGTTRTDYVVLRLDFTLRKITAELRAGAAPVQTLATGSVWELPIAQVPVAAGATSIAAGTPLRIAPQVSSGDDRARGVLGTPALLTLQGSLPLPGAAGNNGTEFLVSGLKVGPVYLPTARNIEGFLKMDMLGSVDGLRAAGRVRCNVSTTSNAGTVTTSDPQVAGGITPVAIRNGLNTRPTVLTIPFWHTVGPGWATWQASFFQDNGVSGDGYVYLQASTGQPPTLLVKDAGRA